MKRYLKILFLTIPLLVLSTESSAIASKEYRPTLAYEETEATETTISDPVEEADLERQTQELALRWEEKIESHLKAEKYIIAIIAIFALIPLAFCVFWFFMLVHALTKPIENKVVWVIVLIFLPFLGALLYYFVVKRNFDASKQA